MRQHRLSLSPLCLFFLITTAMPATPPPAVEIPTEGDGVSAPSLTLPRPSQQLRLWDGPAPGVPANPGPEITEEGDRRSHISVPTLDVYLPDPKIATGEAVIICAGGAYTRVVAGPRGAGAAARFLPAGIAVFSLKYRVAPPSTDVLRDALADARRAVRLVRHRAVEWKIDPQRVGVVGFSAGANLTLNLAGHSDPGDPSSADPIERLSSRPDFIGLCCTWPYTQKITDFKIDASHPPAFVLHARDDKTAPFAFSESIVAAWKKAGVPVRFEPYATGGHGAFSVPNEKAKDWPGKFRSWLKTLR